jgi:polyisoprenoid-binding protein YceI
MRRLVPLALLLTASVAYSQVPAASTAPVPAGAYTLDKSHASLVFRVDHLGFSKFTGRFTRYDASLQFDPSKLAASRVTVTIDPRSIHSDNAPEGFLDALAGSDWLNAAAFPEMKFVSQRVETTSANHFRVHGDLTIHGVSKPMVLEASYNGGYASHPFDPQARVGFSATGTFKRSDFGVAYGVPAPGSTFGVADEVSVVLEAEFTGPPAK